MDWIYCGSGVYIHTTHITYVRHTRSHRGLGFDPGLFEVYLANGACIPVIWNNVNPQPYEALEKFLTEQTS